VLGLPTGSTPEGFYAALAQSGADFRAVQTFNLDEYLGLPREHDQSYYTFMKRHIYDRVNLDPAHTHVPFGMAADPEAECRSYEAAIREASGIDVMLLGIGHNGHIGFNEPGTPWTSRTRRVELAAKTRQANARFFGSIDGVPREALTMGIGTILESRQIILLASGEGKAEIIRRTLEGEAGVDVPATALQGHPNVTVLLDRAAAMELCETVA
jgi:glucosamine-6-phosphate deaminase